MKEREPLPARVAEEQRERLRMEKVMADLEYLVKRYGLDVDEVEEIAKGLNRMQKQADSETK